MGIFRPFRFIQKQEIEAKATDILRRMEQTEKYDSMWPLDTSSVAEFLGLDVVWDGIPEDEYGIIAARILPLERLIEINDNLPICRGGFGESTIAHEIGHWILHVNPVAVNRFLKLKKRGVCINEEPFLCRNDNAIRGIEWQAQYFADCLLMPQYILEEKQKRGDLSRWRHLDQIADELGVSRSNLVHRLQDLGWINIREDSRQIYLNEVLINQKKMAVG